MFWQRQFRSVKDIKISLLTFEICLWLEIYVIHFFVLRILFYEIFLWPCWQYDNVTIDRYNNKGISSYSCKNNVNMTVLYCQIPYHFWMYTTLVIDKMHVRSVWWQNGMSEVFDDKKKSSVTKKNVCKMFEFSIDKSFLSERKY